MITRGYYIGEIIDELSAVAAQVKMRNRLNFTDLSVFTENFFRDVVNCLMKLDLKNLNEDRSNEPGVDLGDEIARLAIQVTSTADTKKVNLTLETISPDQQSRYDKFVILSIGGKQSKYSFDKARAKALKFSTKDIWDMNTLARKAVGLEIERLGALHKLIRANVARVKVELEVPDETGKYATSGYDQWEIQIKAKVGDGTKFAAYFAEQGEVDLSEVDLSKISKGVTDLGKRLSRLPRVTREFLVTLVERREGGRSKRFSGEWIHLLLSKVERQFQGRDLKGELEILDHADFVSVSAEDPYDSGPPEIGVHFSNVSDDLAAGFLDFIKDKKLNLRRVLGDADLSDF